MGDFDPISAAGQERKAQILAASLTAAASKRRRRIGVRAVAAAVPVLGLAAMIIFNKAIVPGPRIGPVVQVPSTRPPTTPPGAPQPVIRIERIETDPTLADRLAARPSINLVSRVTDDQLLAGLAEGKRPAGLATVNGRTMLVFHDASAPKRSGSSETPEF
jgi:hypothetical protein